MPCSELEIRNSFAICGNSTLSTAHQPLVEVFALAESHHLLLQSKICLRNYRSSCRFVCTVFRAWRFFSITLLVELLVYFQLDFSLLMNAQTPSSSLKGKLERNRLASSDRQGLSNLVSVDSSILNDPSSFLIEVVMFISLILLELWLIRLFEHLLYKLTS